MLKKNIIFTITLFVLILMVNISVVLSQNHQIEFRTGHSLSPDSLITAEYFGFDFWTIDISFWQTVFDQMEEDSLQMNLVGTDAVKWFMIEPEPPVNGVHSYNWSTLDAAMAVVAQSGKILEMSTGLLSNWGTIVRWDDMDQTQCCQMSPPKEDADSDTTAWGMTAYEAWYDFIYNLVERYDGDGLDDAAGVNRSVIKHLMLGNEPEAAGHFFSNGGTIARYHRMLKTSYLAAKAANPDIIFIRGKSNPGPIFDDNPDSLTLQQRNDGGLDSLIKFFSFPEQYYDIFAINFNDHYTGLAPNVRWLSNEMNKNGFSKPFLIADARTTLYPRDNSRSEHVLPPRYADDFMPIVDNPDDPHYPEYKKILQADEVRQSLHKILVALGTGQKSISLQPVYSPLQGNVPGRRRYMWLYSGFFDPYIYETTADLKQAREPIYFALKQLTDLLVGAARKVETLDLGEWVYAYKFRKKEKEFIILWHENPWMVDPEGLVQRNQQKTLDLSGHFVGDEVLVQYFVTELGEDNNPVYPAPETISAHSVCIDETPIIISSIASTTIQGTKIDLPVTFSLSQNYPNPFNPETTIRYHLARSARVEIAIYNVLGKKIRILVNEKKKGGAHSVVWDGTDAAGHVLSSGIFYYQLVADNNRSVFHKMILLK